MSYTEPSGLEDKKLSLIYVAGETAEAKGIESLLTEQEIMYALEAAPLRNRPLFEGSVELPGVGFLSSRRRHSIVVICYWRISSRLALSWRMSSSC